MTNQRTSPSGGYAALRASSLLNRSYTTEWDATEARQSSLPALWILDCFAPLTMTEF